MRQEFEIALLGIKTLKANKLTRFNQKQISEQLKFIGFDVSTSTISNLVHYKKHRKKGKGMGKETLNKIVEGLKKLISLKLSMRYEESQNEFVYQEGLGKENGSMEKEVNGVESYPLNYGLTYYPYGRTEVEHKVKWMKQVKSGDTIIELGLRLHSFANFFTTKRADRYRTPVKSLLARGVNLDCLLLNPNGQFAKPYFDNRCLLAPDELFKDSEKKAFNQMSDIVDQLKVIQLSINNEGYEGKMSLYMYDISPEFHAFVAGDTMLISHYMQGVYRTDTPLLEIQKKSNEILFEKYLLSINAIRRVAVKI